MICCASGLAYAHIAPFTILSLCRRIYPFVFKRPSAFPTKYHWRFNFYLIFNIRGFIFFEKTYRENNWLAS